VAARCYVRSSAALDRWIVSFDRSVVPGYAWVFPCGGGLFNVGCGAPYRPGAGRRLGLRGLFGNFTAGFPPAQEVLGKGEVVSPLRGAAVRAGLEGAPPLLGARILVAGETAGTTLPYTGEGIGKAMESGEIAARVLLEALGPGGLGRIADYPARIASELAPRYRGYRAAERWLSRPWIADLLARRTARSGYLTRATEGIFTESADPSEVFSLRGVLRSLWG
jgi:flavin-dependent dehydrogenase